MKRQTSYKVSVADLLSGRITAEEEWQPSHITVRNKDVSRANIIAAVVAKSDIQSLLIDDGTGTIMVRSFDEHTGLDAFEVGTIISMIARVRQYNNERYLTPEIIRKADEKLMHLRKTELEKERIMWEAVAHESDALPMEEMNVYDEDSRAIKVRALVKELDEKNNGNGADAEEIMNSSLENAEVLIKSLIEMGEIFEIRPGKLKVLE